jgi:uncharacterized delta-60 repeat protein
METSRPLRIRRVLRAALVPLFLVLQAAGAAPANAAGGDLDPTLGGDGKVTGPGGDAVAIALQPNGKIVMAGLRGSDFVVARYKSDGTLDRGFGGVGSVTTSFGHAGCTAQANALVVQPDGRIVVAGFAGCAVKFAVARYERDGSLDRSFGGNGRVTTSVGGSACTSSAQGLALQEDGALIAAGWSACNGVNAFALARYGTDGTLDASFGTDGTVVTDLSPYFDQAFGVVAETDGSIVVAGTANLYGHGRFAVARFHSDGTPDETFGGGDGKLKTSFRSPDCGISGAEALAVQQDGRIVVGGFAYCGPTYFALARYLPDGALDTSFDGDGRVTTLLADGDCFDHVFGLEIQTDGKVVAAGGAGCITLGTFGLARYLPDGSLDAAFAGDGTIATEFGNACFSEAEGVVIQPDGKIVAGGIATCRRERFALARYAA